MFLSRALWFWDAIWGTCGAPQSLYIQVKTFCQRGFRLHALCVFGGLLAAQPFEMGSFETLQDAKSIEWRVPLHQSARCSLALDTVDTKIGTVGMWTPSVAWASENGRLGVQWSFPNVMAHSFFWSQYTKIGSGVYRHQSLRLDVGHDQVLSGVWQWPYAEQAKWVFAVHALFRVQSNDWQEMLQSQNYRIKKAFSAWWQHRLRSNLEISLGFWSSEPRRFSAHAALYWKENAKSLQVKRGSRIEKNNYFSMLKGARARFERVQGIFPWLFQLVYQQRVLSSSIALPPELTEDETRGLSPYLFQTHYDKNSIPDAVTEAVQAMSQGWTRFLLDDDDIRIFLLEHYPHYVYFFDSLEGAHRADLARYLLLYTYGGVYLDIKTIPLQPLGSLFQHQDKLTSSLGELESLHGNNAIWQGVLATPPHNPFLLQLAENGYARYVRGAPFHYFFFIEDFYSAIANASENGQVQLGHNPLKAVHGLDVWLLNESCAYGSSVRGLTCTHPDRYGVCCYIFQGDEALLLGRDPDYPWS